MMNAHALAVPLPPWGGIMVVAAIVTLLCSAAVAVSIQFLRAASSRRWPRTPGVIVSSGLVEKRSGTKSTETPDVEYEYRVDGRVLRGNRISFHEVHGPRFSQALVDRYPVGTAVEVSYHPSKPELCVLNPGESWLNVALIAVFPLLALIAAVTFAVELAKYLQP
jgi:hypothetical protein